LLEQQRVDLIVCDLVLPGMGGPDFVELVRSAQPSMPVLYVSGYSSEFARTGLDPFLAKPYTPETLCQRVAQILARD